MARHRCPPLPSVGPIAPTSGVAARTDAVGPPFALLEVRSRAENVPFCLSLAPQSALPRASYKAPPAVAFRTWLPLATSRGCNVCGTMYGGRCSPAQCYRCHPTPAGVEHTKQCNGVVSHDLEGALPRAQHTLQQPRGYYKKGWVACLVDSCLHDSPGCPTAQASWYLAPPQGLALPKHTEWQWHEPWQPPS